MKKLYFKTLYGVNQIVFNVGESGKVKANFDPVYGRKFAFGSSANVKHNLKEKFCELSGLETPEVQFKKKVQYKDDTIKIGSKENDEQGGVSTFIDVNNFSPVPVIFGAWASDMKKGTKKYVKTAMKSCIQVSDMRPVHPLLQKLSDPDTGVFVGDRNSSIVLAIDNDTLYTPEDALEFVKGKNGKITIDDVKELFNQRKMNLYEDKETATGIYEETFAIEIETFGKVDLSSIDISEEDKNTLKGKGWEEIEINKEKYLSPGKERLMELWTFLVDAMLSWDFSSNNSLHGNRKEPLRYSISMDGNKIAYCNSATTYTNDNGKLTATLSLLDHKSVLNFNTPALGKWHTCQDMKLDIDAEEKVRETLINFGHEYIV